jgi:hypothetical protein
LSPRKEGETHTSHYVYSIQVRLIDHAFFFPPTPSLRYIWAYSNLFRRHGERCGYIHLLHSLFKPRKEGQITDVFRTDDSALCGRLSGPFLKKFFSPPFIFLRLLNRLYSARFCVYARGHSKYRRQPFFSFKTIWKNSGASKSSINQHSPAISNVIWRNE